MLFGTNGSGERLRHPAMNVPMSSGTVFRKSRLKLSASVPWSTLQKNSARFTSGPTEWSVLEAGHHAEVATAAAQRPEEVRVFLGRGAYYTAIGEHHLGREQIVGGQPRACESQPMPPPSVDRHAGVADDAAGSRKDSAESPRLRRPGRPAAALTRRASGSTVTWFMAPR